MRSVYKWIAKGSAIAIAASTIFAAGQAQATETGDSAEASAVVIEEAKTEDDRPVVAMGGVSSVSIDPMKGLIRTFTGDIGPHIGRIRTFEGVIDPSKGLIRTFEGDIDPYKGLIRTFWGDLAPLTGELDPKIGRIRTFTDSFLPSSSAIAAAWATAEQSGNYTEVMRLLTQMRNDGQTQWGAEVTRQTGKTFADAVANPFFSKWNVSLNHAGSLAALSATDRHLFLLDWYDTVLNYSGMDRYDHWMNAVRWNPAITQVQGGGSQATIGLVDFFAANDADVRSKVVYSGGYQNVDNAHGAAVGSLIVASHDNRGIMGIAPRAKIAAYNPFDSSFTASWSDVTKAITEVGNRGASVINLSLGVPGYTLPAEWRDVFKTSAIDSFKDKTIYVIAAGNDGVVQRTNIEMNGALDSTFLVVGSVDPFGSISAFSNTPGTACLTDGGTCKNTKAWNPFDATFQKTDYLKKSGLLMNRFLVAPGELILVSDGQGGVTRMSGTSFAAPLVSGAIALIQDRWPWLKNHPRDVAKILLESAQDLGAPGVDPIYGHGLLDIRGAQSALDFNALKYYLVNGSSRQEVKVDTLLTRGVDPIWASKDMYFNAFEKLDNAERDFLIPLSTRLFTSSVNGRMFQKHMYDLFMAWMTNNGTSGFSGFATLTDSARVAFAPNPDGWSYAMRGSYRTVDTRFGLASRLHSTLEVIAPGGAATFAMGNGDGALAIAGNGAMQLSSDFNPHTGGNDPLLGFASGKSHMAAKFNIAPKMRLGVGFTNVNRSINSDFADVAFSAESLQQRQQLGDYEAAAGNVRIDYQVNNRTNVAVSYTRLDEKHAFLGARSLDRSDFGRGVVSQSATFSGDTMVTDSLQVFGSATVAKSDSDSRANLALGKVKSTAWQVGLAKNKLLGSSDHLRLTLAQPLTIENGYSEFKSIGVVDRETGEKGVITQRFSLADSADRRLRMEAHYGATLAGGNSDVALFSSYEMRDVRSDIARWTVGAKARIAF